MTETKKKTPKKKKTSTKSKGLGDTVEKALKTTKLDKVAKWVLGEDCGCEERKQKLNDLFPFGKAECLTEQEYEWLKVWYDSGSNSMNIVQQRELTKIFNRVFHKKTNVTNCNKCVLDKVRKLRKVFDTYESKNG